ncbi:MAG: hypothetical protein H3C35_06340 [Bacteroidetes bacterium]|nr:hypothetical protein [Bacteroidota bacterium]
MKSFFILLQAKNTFKMNNSIVTIFNKIEQQRLSAFVYHLCLVLFLFFPITMVAQQSDSTIIFESPNPEILSTKIKSNNDAWGVDILLSNNGFGGAVFYRRTFSRDLSGTITLGLAQSKDDNEVEYVTWYGATYTPGKINRFLIAPLLLGAEYRLFADDIMDSFRPYVNAGAGPTFIFVAPYADNNGNEREFFSSLGDARTKYTLGAYVGFGAYFGSDMGSLAGINIRYYFIPFKSGIPSLQQAGPDPYTQGPISKKTDFGGFFITINFGSAF